MRRPRRSRRNVDLKPYWGKPAVRNFRGGRGNGMHGLMSLCHEVRKNGYNGSHWPKHHCASSLLDAPLFLWVAGSAAPSDFAALRDLWVERNKRAECPTNRKHL